MPQRALEASNALRGRPHVQHDNQRASHHVTTPSETALAMVPAATQGAILESTTGSTIFKATRRQRHGSVIAWNRVVSRIEHWQDHTVLPHLLERHPKKARLKMFNRADGHQGNAT